jgi:hypothetical protein
MGKRRRRRRRRRGRRRRRRKTHNFGVKAIRKEPSSKN